MRIAADANVLLAALIGGNARRILRHVDISEVLTSQFNLDEVGEYAVQIAKRKGLATDSILLALATLPVTIVQRTVYRRSLAEARRRMAHRDADDVDLLALALHFDAPVWSNDNDFADAGVEWYTTAQLLAKLG